MSADHWYLLPVGFAIAVLAMSSGVSAGNFWVPVYLLWARFEPPLAFWMTLATMLCGYGSGVERNLRQGTLDRRIISHHLPFALPAALVGGYLAPALNISWLVLLLGLFVLGYGAQMVLTLRKSTVEESELLLPRLLTTRKSLSPAEIVGSTVLLIFVTSLAAVLVRLNGPFLAGLSAHQGTLLGAMVFAGPGVLLGGQLGPMMARRLNRQTLRRYVAVVLLLVGLLMLGRFAALVVFIP